MKCTNCVEGLVGEDTRKVCGTCKGTTTVLSPIKEDEEVQKVEPTVELGTVEEESFLEESGENWDDVSSQDS